MGISRFDSRFLILFLALMISAMIAASAAAAAAQTGQGDIFDSGDRAGRSPSGGLVGVIISITPMGINRDDVKLQDPVTGYIHSVTVEADVVNALGATGNPGRRVMQSTNPQTGEITLAPAPLLTGQVESGPGQPEETDNGEPPAPSLPEGPADNGGVPPTQTGGNNGGVPPPRTGGVTGGGGAPPYYPAPQVVGNLTGQGSVEGIPVEIGGPGSIPVPVPVPGDRKPPQTVTVKNRTGQGNWKGFRGPLQTDGSGYSVWFNEGFYDGYYKGNYQRGWFRLPTPQSVPVHAG